MERAFFSHPKTKKFARELGVPIYAARGLLLKLFDFVGEHAPEGNIGKWENDVITEGAGWDGDPAAFIDALVAAGWLDSDGDGRFVIHDWEDHAPRWVKQKIKRIRERRQNRGNMNPHDDIMCAKHGVKGHTIPRHTIHKDTKGGVQGGKLPDPPEEWSADLTGAFNDWVEYKRETGHRYKPAGMKQLIGQIRNRVEEYGEREVIDAMQSAAANGWAGWDFLKDRRSNGTSAGGRPGKQLLNPAVIRALTLTGDDET